MKPYWDLTEAERAKLTEEEVTKLLDFELMAKGVLRPDPPKFESVEPVSIPKGTVYVLLESDGYSNSRTNLGIGFTTLDAAKLVAGAITWIRTSSWNEPNTVRPVRDIQVATEELPSAADVLARKSVLDENARRERTNAEEERTYEEALKKVAEATSDVWSNYWACKKTEAWHEKIRATLAEYVKMTGGDEKLARGFLAKAFPPDEIHEALGDPPPDCAPPPLPVPAEEAPKKADGDEIPW